MEMLSNSHTDHESEMAVRYMDLLEDYIREIERNEKLRKEIRRLESENWALKRKRKFRG